MARKRKKIASILDLAWDDLNEWAGSKIVSRGRSYKRAVKDLSRTEDGKLLAWVQGTRRYATRVGMDENGELACDCTCRGPCKHAVAVILVYLDAMKEKREVSGVDKGGERLRLLEGSGDASESWETEDNGDFEDEFGDYVQEDDVVGAGAAKKERSRRKDEGKWVEPLRTYLDGLPRQALTDLVLESAERYPDFREMLGDRMHLQSGRVNQMVASLRREIQELSNEPAWTNHWSDEGYVPDYSRVRERMQALLENGHADAIVLLGKELFRRGIRQVEMSHDEGETGWELGSCMEVVFDALRRSSLKPADRLLWVIDAYIEDDYGILDGIDNPISRYGAAKQDWSQVADALSKRLDEKLAEAKSVEDNSFSSDYRRQVEMRWLIQALEKAGRKREVIPLLQREAPITDCYRELVDRLVSARRREDARRWAKEGFAKTIESSPGIAWSLEAGLRDMAARAKNWDEVAVYSALEFFGHPNVSTYAALENASGKVGCWPDVRAAVLHYLETGNRTDIQPTEKPGRRPRKAPSSAPHWPLPPTELEIPAEKPKWRTFPDTNVLIDIAIRENRPDDVLKWYQVQGESRGIWDSHNDDKIAQAVQKTHPNVALSIWKKMAEAQIARVQPAAYLVAKVHLRKMQTVYRRENRLSEWRSYLATLREDNRRRPRMIEVLDSLEHKRKRIIDS